MKSLITWLVVFVFLVQNMALANTRSSVIVDTLALSSQMADVIKEAQMIYTTQVVYGKLIENGIQTNRDIYERIEEIRQEISKDPNIVEPDRIKCLVFPDIKRKEERAYYIFNGKDIFWRITTAKNVDDNLSQIILPYSNTISSQAVNIQGKVYYQEVYKTSDFITRFINNALKFIYPEAEEVPEFKLDKDKFVPVEKNADKIMELIYRKEKYRYIPLARFKADLNIVLAREEKSGRLFVIKDMPSADEERYGFCAYEVERRITEDYPNVYHPKIMMWGWAEKLPDEVINTSEGLYAVVYPYIEGQTFNEYFNKFRDQPLSSYILELMGKVIKVAEIGSYLEKKGLPGVWDFKNDNIIITPNGDVVLIDYTRMGLDSVKSINWLLYALFQTGPIKDIISNFKIVNSDERNKKLNDRFRKLNMKVYNKKFSSIEEYHRELVSLRKIVASILKGEHGLNLEEVRNEGALVFDVDGTLLDKKRGLDSEPGLLNILLDLLEGDFKVVFISGNSRADQRRRIWEPIKNGLIQRGILNNAQNLIMYVNGGATKVTFDSSGNEVMGYDYNKDKMIEEEDIEIIKDVLTEMLKEKLGLKQDELAEWKKWFSRRDDFPNIKFDLSWIEGDVKEILVVSAEDINTVIEGKKPGMDLISPWIETRDDAQASIKLLPKLPRDIRTEVIERIKSELEKRGRGGRLILKTGGFASIDINRIGIDKNTAINDLVKHPGIENTKALTYFGDEFGKEGNDLPVLKLGGLKVFAVSKIKDDIAPELKDRIEWIGAGPEATKKFLKENLEDLNVKDALKVLGLEERSITDVLWGTSDNKSQFRLVVEKFMGVKDLVVDQRIPGYKEEAETRVKKALRQVALKLATLNKPLKDITQSEFNSILGVSQVVLAGGIAQRYHSILHKGLGPIEITGDTNMRLAIWGCYKSPETKPVIAISNRLIIWLLKDEIIEELINSGKNIEPFMIDKLQELGLDLVIRNGVIQKGVVMPDSIIDPDKKALFFIEDAIIVYSHQYGYGDAFGESLLALKELGLLNQTGYKQYVFAEMAEAGLPARSNASLITYLEAIANDSLITMGTKEADPIKQARDISAKKGNLFLRDGKFIALTDASDIPNYQKERLRRVLGKLAAWGKLSSEEKEEIKKQFAVTDDGRILIHANCGIFRNDIVNYFSEFYNYGEEGNKLGFLKIEIDEYGREVSSYQIDPKKGEPIYTAPNLVETVSRSWLSKGWNILDLPIGCVNTGYAPSSIKEMDAQKLFNNEWLGYIKKVFGKEGGIFLGPNARRKLDELTYYEGTYLSLEDLDLFRKRKNILRKQLFYTAIRNSKNYRSLLYIFNGDREELEKNIYLAANYLGIEQLQVVLGILGEESYYSFGLEEVRIEKPRAPPHVVTLTGGTAMSAFLLEAIKEAGFKSEDMDLLIAALIPTLDDGGSTYEIITNLNKNGYGVLPPIGDQANVLLVGLNSLDRVKYILSDNGRVREGLIEKLNKEGKEATLENVVTRLLKDTYNDTELVKSPDFLYFASNLLAASRIVDINYIKKGILSLKRASIRNLFLFAILHEYGLLVSDKAPGSPAIDNEDKGNVYNRALLNLAKIAGVREGLVVPVSFEPATLYARYEDNSLIWEEEKDGRKLYKVVLIKPEQDRIRVRFKLEEDTNGRMDNILGNGETVTIDTGINKINITNQNGEPLIDINNEEWILRENNNQTILVNRKDENTQYILANDGSGQVRKHDEKIFKSISTGGIKIYLRPRLITMQTNITESVNFSRIVEVGLLDKFMEGKPSSHKKLDANPEAVRLIDEAQDMVIIGPGGIFTSILPFFMVPEIVSALERAREKGKRVVWIMNGTVDNETFGLTVSDVIGFMERISGKRLEDIFTGIICTSFDEKSASPKLKQVLYQKPVVEVREPGTATRESKKSWGPLILTPGEIRELKRRGLSVYQDNLLCVMDMIDRTTGKVSHRICHDSDKVGNILKKINQGVVWSHEIKEEWQIISFNPESKLLKVKIGYYWRGESIGECYLDIDQDSASINTCYLKLHKTGQDLAKEMLSRAYIGAYYISSLLGWNTRWAHAYFTLSKNQERESEYWPVRKWDWLIKERLEVKIISGLGLIQREDYLKIDPSHYNNRVRPLAEFVDEAENKWLEWFYKNRAKRRQGENYWDRVKTEMKDVEKKVIEALKENAGRIAEDLIIGKKLIDYSYDINGKPLQVKEKIDIGRLTEEEKEILLLLVDLGQIHLFNNWDPKGINEEKKREFLKQVSEINTKYPGGLRAYIENVKRKLEEIKTVNLFKDYIANMPSVFNLEGDYDEIEKKGEEGLKYANKMAVVLVAGGLGERLGYNGIKIGIPLSLANGMTYLEFYCKWILALQKKSNKINNENRKIPFVIMTSSYTHDKTIELLEKNNYFGMAKDQIILLKQALVPAVADNNGSLLCEENNPYRLQAKPHGHGDIHMLLHQNGLIDKWNEEGITHTVIIQDTNGQTFNSVLPLLSVSIEKGYDINIATVSRDPSESMGAVFKMVDNEGKTIIVIVEYNQLGPLLRDLTGKDDVAKNPYPGNVNLFILNNDVYARVLKTNRGIISEFVNPKYTDEEKTKFKPVRLETRMQDISWAFSEEGFIVGVTNFSKRDVFSPVKNSLMDAGKKIKTGNYPNAMPTAEFDFYKYGRKLLKLAGMDVDVDGIKRITQGIPYTEGAKVILLPSFATTIGEVKNKVKGGKISDRSILVIDGEDIELENVEIDGTLIIEVADGVKLNIKDLVVKNEGWEYVDLSDIEMAGPDIPEYLKIRGYKVFRKAQTNIKITDPGEYIVKALDAKGNPIIEKFKTANEDKKGPIGKNVREDEEYIELWQAEIEDGRLSGERFIGSGEKYVKSGKINKDLLEDVIKKIISIYGQGILAVVDGIRVADNIESIAHSPQSTVKVVPYGMIVEEEGKNVLLLDVDAFSDEGLLYIVLEHELKESIMSIVPCENDAIRELTTNFMSLKLALEKGIKIDKAKLEELGADLQFFTALEVLQAIKEAGEEITDEKIVAVVIEYMRSMPYYEGLFRQFEFADNWGKAMQDIKDAKLRYESALRVFNEIMSAKQGLEKTVEEIDINIRVINTFTGKMRILGLEGLPRGLQGMIGAVAKLIYSIDRFAGSITKATDRKYIYVDSKRLEELKGIIGDKEYGRIVKNLSSNNYQIVIELSKVPEDVDLKNVIRLVDPSDLEKIPEEERVKGMFCLPMPYVRSSFYIAAHIVSVGGDFGRIDPLVKELIRAIYKDLSDDELGLLLTQPWQILPKIRSVISDLNNLRTAIAQIEKAA